MSDQNIVAESPHPEEPICHDDPENDPTVPMLETDTSIKLSPKNSKKDDAKPESIEGDSSSPTTGNQEKKLTNELEMTEIITVIDEVKTPSKSSDGSEIKDPPSKSTQGDPGVTNSPAVPSIYPQISQNQ